MINKIKEFIISEGNELVDFSKWTHKEWEDYRNQQRDGLPTVGGSEISMLSGSSPYGGPYLMYMKKTQPKLYQTNIDPAYSKTGHMMEPLMRTDVQEQLEIMFPEEVVEVHTFDYLVHNNKRAVNAICNLDGIVTIGEKTYVLELKTMSSNGVLATAKKGVIPYHYDQALYYSDIYKFDGIIFGYMKKGILFPIDITIIDMDDNMRKHVDELYTTLDVFNTNLLHNVKPQPNEADYNMCDDLTMLKPDEIRFISDKEVQDKLETIVTLAEKIKADEELLKELKSDILDLAHVDTKFIMTEDFKVNVISRKSPSKLDMEMLKVLQPEALSMYTEQVFSENKLKALDIKLYGNCVTRTVSKYVKITKNQKENENEN